MWANPDLLEQALDSGLLDPQALTRPILPSPHLLHSGSLDDLKLLKPLSLIPAGLRPDAGEGLGVSRIVVGCALEWLLLPGSLRS